MFFTILFSSLPSQSLHFILNLPHLPIALIFLRLRGKKKKKKTPFNPHQKLPSIEEKLDTSKIPEPVPSNFLRFVSNFELPPPSPDLPRSKYRRPAGGGKGRGGAWKEDDIARFVD